VAYARRYETDSPDRGAVDALPGATVVELGTNWCGYCTAAQVLVEAAFATHPEVRHLKVEDGKGRPLGRSFGVKLWPTLVFLRDGAEVARLVRPESAAAIEDALGRIDAAGTGDPASA
jgi:thioredoxin 1